MKRALSYLRRLLDDPIFQRVAAALFMAPIAVAGAVGAVVLRPTGWQWVIWVLLVAVCLYGSVIIIAAVFGSDATFRRAASYMEDGGHPAALVLIVVVALVAIPITMLIRKVRGRRHVL